MGSTAGPTARAASPAGKAGDVPRAGHPPAACGIGIYRDDLLGKEFTGNAFTCEPANMLVHRLVLSPKNSTFSGRRAADEQNSEFLASPNGWFRPVQAVTGPDGCLWI